MSNITVLAISVDASQVTLSCHYAVLVGNNSVGVPWSTALVNSGFVRASILPIGTGPGQISSPDAAAILAGTLREIVITPQVLGLATVSGAQAQAALAAAYNAAITVDQAQWQAQLAYFGAAF